FRRWRPSVSGFGGVGRPAPSAGFRHLESRPAPSSYIEQQTPFPEDERIMAETIAARRAALKPVLEQALELAADRCRGVGAGLPDYHPMYTVGGRWAREGE